MPPLGLSCGTDTVFHVGDIPHPFENAVPFTWMPPVNASFGVEKAIVRLTVPPAAVMLGLVMLCVAEMLFTNPAETGANNKHTTTDNITSNRFLFIRESSGIPLLTLSFTI
ncbi:MAG: hypothetical protein ABR999_01140 [Methanoregula sp.]|uniref:hypothetical protein n=1 Tax=Methanoregula sp. TaxID=2052170 RepID=UPI003D150920